jgi:hypothetical protein
MVEPPLPGAVKVGDGWEIEIQDLDQLVELSKGATVALIRPNLQTSRREAKAGKPTHGEVYLMVDQIGGRFQQR